MDVNNTFLHGDLEEEIYMKKPEGFVVKVKEELVCKLKKSLSGLKQSCRIWCKKFETYILELELVRRKVDHYVSSKRAGNSFICIVFDVENIELVGNDIDAIKEVKKQLSSKFDTKDIKVANIMLGSTIKRDKAIRKPWLNQRKYIETVLKRFNMKECKPVNVPILVGIILTTEQCPKTWK